MLRGNTKVTAPIARSKLLTLGSAGFALALILSVFIFARATYGEFRWIAPIAAAAVNLCIVAMGAWLTGAPAKQTDRVVQEPGTGTRNVTRLVFWRRQVSRACMWLRAVCWWPWLVVLSASGALLLCAATGFIFDRRPLAQSPNARTVMTVGCCMALALALATLIVERAFAAQVTRNRANLLIAGMLRALLIVTLVGAACAALDAWQGVDARWLAIVGASLPAAIACEFLLRVVANWFTPPEVGAAPLTPVSSAIARWLTRPHATPAELGEALHRRYGIDLRQNWVISSTVRLLPGACVAFVAAAWLLSGVSVLQSDQRAVYERFGAAVSVWQPGLHVGFPWPFGHTRLLENGAVHQIVISNIGGDAGDARAAAPLVAADARTPEQLDRMWDVAHPWETTQVIAGGKGHQQNFEVVNADVRIDYRIGQTDAAARASQYRFNDAPSLIRSIGSREVLRYLASHTLDVLVETRQTVIADAIRQAVAQQLDALGSGIEVLAVVLESVHPPAGASAAWHNVQASQIRAVASVAQARGLAATVVGSARESATSGIDAASASAAETLSAARARQISFTADIAAQSAGGQAFPFEYYLHALQKGLQSANLTVIDDGLVGGHRATIDLRAYNAGDAAGAKRLY
ncbi:regulator of protease activity HflC (stomatin/prohibitin superfamily) [Paraburkholderia sp. BL21I4N1]|nr:regulator of protease activity HflC (stomatin/prohibitin superfamily) [Paraburkholderia sp. BL21I4N1]